MIKKIILGLSIIGSSGALMVSGADVLDAIPAAKNYQLVYQKDLAKLADETYDLDNTAKITKPFDRVAYCLELQKAGEDKLQYVFVSMDAFTTEINKIGIPRGKTIFQQPVKNLEVFTNVDGVKTGNGITGNIEFWNCGYSPENKSGVPNASDKLWDWGDTPDGVAYGSMQVHNPDASQCIMCINRFYRGGEMGIGNNPDGMPDWTNQGNGDKYSVKTLRVFVHTK